MNILRCVLDLAEVNNTTSSYITREGCHLITSTDPSTDDRAGMIYFISIIEVLTPPPWDPTPSNPHIEKTVSSYMTIIMMVIIMMVIKIMSG